MLHAILHGKARRVDVSDKASQSWRSVFQHYEDLLTAAFWGRISYLSQHALQALLSSLLAADIREWGKFESLTFWPKYPFPDELDSAVAPWINEKDKYAEPDVVLTFEHATLIVEVKPPAGGQQYQQQWCKEIYAWKNSEEAQQALHFLAIGNLPKEAAFLFAGLQTLFPEVKFYGAEWREVRAKMEHPASAWPTEQDQRIIADCLRALELYGVRAPLLPWQPFLTFLHHAGLPADFPFLQGKP
ncbi:hypothetical protein [Kosakonia cowanii]|uniref:hypothetical protein n=1 Tax=Kosakonia cowanii TaxID=208223 RepID=UPI004063F5D9